MSTDKKRSIMHAILSGIKYFVITLAFLYPILSIGNVISDEKIVHSKVIEKITESINEGELQQDWFSVGKITFPEKYITEADSVAKCYDENCNDDLNLMLVSAGVCFIGAMAIITYHIFSVLSENNRLYNRYVDLCNEMDEDERPYITRAFATKINKKMLDPKITIILPIIITTFSVITMSLIIHQYGGRMSNNINGIVRRYGLEYSEKAMDNINEICDTDVTINVSLHPNRMVDTSENDIRSIVSATGTYYQGTTVINHRMIPYGMIVCVKIDMAKYYNVILGQIILLLVYFVYLTLSVFDNLPVIRFLAMKKYIMRGR